MTIPVVCPSCSHHLSAPDSAAGRKAKCSKCGGVVMIPGVPAKQSSALPAKQTSAPPANVRQQVPAVAKPTLPVRATAIVEQTRPLAIDLRVQHALVPSAPAPTPATKECPFCGEQVLTVAKKCKHCGEILDVALRVAMTPAPAQQVVQQFVPAAPASIQITNVNTNIANAGVSRKRWSRIVAFLLSLLIPGLGQLYKGQVLSALVWFIVVAIGYVAFIIPGIVLHICCALGAAMGDPYR